ncbi:hypothetical protein [Deferrisoma camini]|uniref:hypothetical protein n=1 Tax=Deferrisoma camini TaxID=1035120 RepID=UPI00146DE3A9|nr:hypothetical protein [Deferrisoma camini]
MARIRTIKPSFFLDDELAELPYAARLLFAGLWCLADREGRLEDRPKRIKAEVLPYDDEDVDALLTALAEAGFVQRYEVDGARYIQVVNFAKHQKPNHREAASTIPPPGGNGSQPFPGTPGHAQERQGTRDNPSRAYPGGTGREQEGNIASSSLRSEDACAEPSRAPAPALPAGTAPGRDEAPPDNADPPPVITLPTNRRGTEYPVTKAQVAEWAELYPAVDVVQELRKMRGWLLANKTRRKTARGMPKFINAWLTKEQDRGGAKARASPATPTSGNGRGLAAAVSKFGARVRQEVHHDDGTGDRDRGEGVRALPGVGRNG